MPLPSKSLDAVKRLWPALKWGLFLLVLVFVARHGWRLWTGFDQVATPIHWGWLALAVVTSQIAWVPSVWYWRELMAVLGAPAPFSQVARAYFCGNMGKYVPGKGAAIVIRSALLGDCKVPGATAALTVVVETLTFVWVGTLLAILLYPAMAPHLPRRIDAWAGDPLLRWGMAAVAVCGGLLAFAAMMRSHGPLADWFHGPSIGSLAANDAPLGRMAPSIRLVSVVVLTASWWMQGLMLGLTIHAVSADDWNWSDWPFWTGTVAVAMVGGFAAVFAPAGLGVREGLLMELLERQLGPREAVLVALLLRGVTLAGEILAAVALYYGVATKPGSQEGEPGA
jgi:uncharacterized membrane protein YbhN (UPF0104 family)